jgi:hypothetical protein
MTETPDEEHVDTRAELLPEEQEAGSDDPRAQAEEILEESQERTDDPEGTRRESTQTPDQQVPNEPPPA